jgi:hypothetical protein
LSPAAEALAKARAAGCEVTLADGGQTIYALQSFVPLLKPFKAEIIELLRAEVSASVIAKFEHYCHCGQWGAFGYGVGLRIGQMGQWFCSDHRPVSKDTTS